MCKRKNGLRNIIPTDAIIHTRALEHVHSDVCEPLQNQSTGSNGYFVSITDDFSRYAHVYFADEKLNVFFCT